MSDSNNPHDVLRHQASPEVLREMEELRARLAEYEGANVVTGRFAGEAPRYKLNEACYLDDTLFSGGTVLEYTGMPNMQMVPLNDPARRMIQEHIAMLEEGQRRLYEEKGRSFTGLVTDRGIMIAQGLQDARREAQVQHVVPVERGYVPPMPNAETPQQAEKRGRGRPKKVISATPPDASPRAPTMTAESGPMPGIEPQAFGPRAAG